MVTLSQNEQGDLVVQGVLNYASVPEIHLVAKNILPKLNAITVDLSQVEYSDSAGLALLAEWYRYAKQRQIIFSVKQPPVQLLAIANVTGMANVLQFKQ